MPTDGFLHAVCMAAWGNRRSIFCSWAYLLVQNIYYEGDLDAYLILLCSLKKSLLKVEDLVFSFLLKIQRPRCFKFASYLHSSHFLGVLMLFFIVNLLKQSFVE